MNRKHLSVWRDLLDNRESLDLCLSCKSTLTKTNPHADVELRFSESACEQSETSHRKHGGAGVGTSNLEVSESSDERQ